MSQSQQNNNYKRAYKLVIRHYTAVTLQNWRQSLPGFTLPALGSILVFYIPALILSKIVESATQTSDKTIEDFLPLLGLFVGSWLLGEVLWRIGIHFASEAEAKGARTLYKQGLEKLLQKDVGFFNDNFAGSLTKRTVAYSTRFIDASDTLLFNVFPNIIPVLFALVVLSTYSIWLSALLITSIVVAILIIAPLIKKRKHLVTIRETAANVASGHIADVYGNIATVKAHASEKAELKRHSLYVNDFIKKTLHSWHFQNQRIDTIISPLYVSINAAGLILAIKLVLDGQIHFSALIVVYSYFANVTRFIWEFNGIYRRLETALSDAAQYTELLIDEPTIQDPSTPRTIANPQGKISIQDIHFRYEKNSDKLFDHFSLSIPAGQHLGLVGRSGGGKSSITKLLLRFSDVDSGSILIDDTDIRDLTQSDLRSLIAYVPQDPSMFHRTIAENIAYGKPDASREAIESAAKHAHAHEFIVSLPDGYETLVGERGVKLSGGQRQRIAIARAMLKDAPILLLDEATSALDSESELLIQDALWKLMKDKTAIVIAHRLSTIQKMDKIVVLDQGNIVEQGSHEELLEQQGTYAELWSHQSGGFIEE